MQWEDTGILLKKQKFGETHHIFVFLTKEHGKHAGLYRGKTSLPESGEHIKLTWKARLHDHLGEWSGIERQPRSPLIHIFGHSGKLYALSSALSLTEKTLADRDAHPALYEYLVTFIKGLQMEDTSWILAYISYEISLLREIGFGMDLSKCAVTGNTENLAFVSPKTGHAVTCQGGAGYLDRLLPLPSFLRDLDLSRTKASPPLPEPPQLHEAFALTKHFLEKCVASCNPSSFKNDLPPYRMLLVNWVEMLKQRTTDSNK
ncbi:MAG: DNA repair protein RecO [Alphaproteobacteria bacterium 16-39-46]|nr:MAG: DNA repair protein RecO [Alphaproteobacteria bacterium 16-39-46]OZA41360.1 MAG: DNA repair protein RecO [Alphaproteobacteria bacterium 17-39-52]HQS84849.1 DNA repair protein RecO [Alphaproteobacteria bacterium]HQS94612.1 DNA repair protein RecO [Alphaproteobacteria bacterium]